ncbi:hypothetical protein C457_19193 [Haloferax prahovense DSM 18310]|uniref:Uncharacterized protein n=1 Tax=Haloferax prahovense (strain DSM 18310 / JCM 13924 / TL6) TaxID=1227461 RepID=M0FVR6_HALPT|nr:hypothetical protein C457_19193 [Haloferax prahovense DSM 18310]
MCTVNLLRGEKVDRYTVFGSTVDMENEANGLPRAGLADGVENGERSATEPGHPARDRIGTHLLYGAFRGRE